MSNEIDIDKLEALARAATPGPWRWGGEDPEGGERRSILNLYAGGERSRPILWLEPSSGWITAGADTEHIAAASPDVVLALIERLRRAESEIAALKTDAAMMDDVARDAAR